MYDTHASLCISSLYPQYVLSTPSPSPLYVFSLVVQVIEEERQEREEAKKRREEADALEANRGQDVSDTDLMNKMFGFLDDENQGGDGRTTDAFGEFKLVSQSNYSDSVVDGVTLC